MSTHLRNGSKSIGTFMSIATMAVLSASQSASAAVPTAGLEVWLKADAITGLSDGQSVTAWTDSSASGRTFSSAVTAPTFHTGAIGGASELPVVRFGGGGFLYTDDVIALVPGETYVAVFRTTSIAPAGGIATPGTAIMGQNNAGNSVFGVSSGKMDFHHWDSDGGIGGWHATTGTAAVNDGDAHYSVVTSLPIDDFSSPIRTHLYVDGQLDGSSDHGFATGGPNSIDRIGGGYGASNYFVGDIAEILVYSRALSSTELADVNSYIQSKYAIPEPGAASLLGGVLAIGALRRRRRTLQTATAVSE